MKREDLRVFLEREVARWSAKPYGALRQELRVGNHTEAEAGADYHLEVDVLENREDYVHVSIAVCSERAKWSCIHPLSASFLVFRDGRVEKNGKCRWVPIRHGGMYDGVSSRAAENGGMGG